MSTDMKRRVPAGFRLALGAALLSSFALAAYAQAPGGGGGFGGFRRPAAGTVSTVDKATGNIIIQTNQGDTQTVKTTGTTTFTTQVTSAVADLKVGDHIQVNGVPTGITVNSITAGESPFPAFGFGRGPGGPGGPGAPAGGAAGAPAGGGNARGQGAARAGGFGGPANAQATGVITATNPLTIKLSDDATLTLTPGANTQVTTYKTTNLAAVKAGDQVIAFGDANDDGTFSATSVGVNVRFGGGFGGGRRGGGGGGGFGGGGGGGFGGG